MKISIEFNPETDKFDKVIGAVGLAYNWHVPDADKTAVQSQANSLLRSVNNQLLEQKAHVEGKVTELEEKLAAGSTQVKGMHKTIDDQARSIEQLETQLSIQKADRYHLGQAHERALADKALLEGQVAELQRKLAHWESVGPVENVTSMLATAASLRERIRRWEQIGPTPEEVKARLRTALGVANELMARVGELESAQLPERDINADRSVLPPVENTEEPPPFSTKEQWVHLCSSRKILKGDLRD
jgi:chromosome segregation ATPase